MLRSQPGWICATGAGAVRQHARAEQSFNQFEADMANKASQARRMVHNERFLNRTLADTASHNKRQAQAAQAALLAASVVGDPLRAPRRQNNSARAAPKQQPLGKVKVTVTEPGSIGLRMQPGQDGRPNVVSVGSRSEAAAQGVLPGMALYSVNGVSTRTVDYQVVIDWIASIEERPVLLKLGPPKELHPTKTGEKTDRKRKEKKKKEKKKKKKKKKGEQQEKKKGTKRKHSECSSSLSSSSSIDADH